MAVGYNPRAVTDGLVLALDAGNPKNYNVGISTNWTDKVGGNNGTLVGGTYHNDGPFVGAGYVEFDGDSDSLTVPASTDFTLDGEFTVEFWIYLNTLVLDSQYPSPITFSQSGGNTGQIAILTTNNYFTLYNGSSDVVTTGNNSVTTGRWYHVAATRDSSNNCRIFLDGVLKDTASSTHTFGNASGDLRIGSFSGTGGDVNGNISNLRIIKGTALYTSNFTPPTKQLTAVMNTVLLTCQGNTIADASSGGHTLTASGTAAANLGFPASAFEFDGVNDGVSLPTITPTGGVTFSAFIYINGNNSNFGTVFANWDDSGSKPYWIGTVNNNATSISVYFNGSLISNFTSLPYYTWIKMDVSHNGSVCNGYINGDLKFSSNSTLTTSSYVTSIGYDINRTNYPFKGNISQVSIYNRALTAAEVAQNYNATKGRYA